MWNAFNKSVGMFVRIPGILYLYKILIYMSK
jgi:hypothetical protein